MIPFRRTAICLVVSGGLIASGYFAGALSAAATDAKSQTSVLAPKAAPLAISPQQTAFLPPLSPAVLEGLKAQDPEKAARRFQIGVARTLDQPIILNAATRANVWTTLPNGWRVSSARVTSSGALGLRVHLESLTLPEGVQVLIYDPAKPAAAKTPITAQSLAGERDFWSETLFTESVVVECQVPPGVDPASVSLSLTGVSHLYVLPSPGSNLKVAAGPCELDVTCYPAWANEASGVASISFVDGGNTYLCSGCLLAESDGNTSGNYFLTAHHCIGSQTVASTLELFWFYQSSLCNGSPPDISTVPNTQGGDLLATAFPSDFTLLRLREEPPSGTAHLAWTTDPPPAGGILTGIHHPMGDYKRISFGHPAGSDSDFWAVQWYSGVTEPGSSGSPLLNANHQVIGQLNGGWEGPGSSCSDPSAPDQYGRFDVTYNSIKTWLGGSSAGQASFVKGTYYGLFQDSGGVSPQSAGSFSMTLSTAGKFSARVQLGTARYSASGKLDASGSAQININRHSLGFLAVAFQLDPQDADHLLGTVSDGTFNADLTADRGVFDGRSNIAPQQGQYTLVIPDQSVPDGNSYGTATVDKTGRVRFSGSLADATKISQSSMVSKNAQWPLFISLYRGQGLVLSWVTFSDASTSDFSGDVSWIRPSLPKAKLYPDGFTAQTSISGCRYSRPARGQSILNLTDANLVLDGGNLDQTISDPVTIDSNNRVVNLGTDKLSLSFSTSSGLFSGRVVGASGTLKSISFRGVVLQKQGIASGYFTGIDQSGQVNLGP